MTRALCLPGAKSKPGTKWIGWAGLEVRDPEGQQSLTEALAPQVSYVILFSERSKLLVTCSKIVQKLLVMDGSLTYARSLNPGLHTSISGSRHPGLVLPWLQQHDTVAALSLPRSPTI